MLFHSNLYNLKLQRFYLHVNMKYYSINGFPWYKRINIYKVLVIAFYSINGFPWYKRINIYTVLVIAFYSINGFPWEN
jgi:hypothetical protein